METIFLGCFLFGALFTVASLVLGLTGAEIAGLHAGHAGPVGHAPGAAHAGSHAGSAVQVRAHGHGGSAHQGAGQHVGLPLLNVSSLLAFVTWFGAAGYLVARFAAWPLIVAVVAAVAAGSMGSMLVAAFLRLVLAGEREMNREDYRLEGTIARVSVAIPAGGIGEIVFTKAGVRRGEAARSLGGVAIPRDTEVVIIEYERGVAAVQAWAEFVAPSGPTGTERGAPPAARG